MNYKKIYNTIIERRKISPYDGYSELHHIIPRSLGGSDNKENLVHLSAREHFICHLLLIKIYPSGYKHYKMIRAFLMMLVSNDTQKRFSPSRNYQYIKEKYCLFLKETYKGEGNSQFGTKWISNPSTNVSMKIEKSKELPDGFYLGRNLKWKKCSKCNIKHFLASSFCEKCKEEYKNRPKKEKREPKQILHKRLKIGKTCPSCKNTFLTFDRTYCSLECSKENGNASVARKVEDDNGNVFNTLTEASKFYKITVEAIRYRIKIGKYKYL